MVDFTFVVEKLHMFWSELSVLTALFVFTAYVVADMLFAYYTLSVSRLEAGRAATTGALMYFLLAIGILNYTHNPLYVIPLVLGSWFGTYFTVAHERQKATTKIT